jgi:hypothetical protein
MTDRGSMQNQQSLLAHQLEAETKRLESLLSQNRQALERIRSFRKTLPPDWIFDREDANARRHGCPRDEQGLPG